MTYYLIYTRTDNFEGLAGFTTDKEILDKFLYQRGKDKFDINAINEYTQDDFDEWETDFLDRYGDLEVSVYGNWYVCKDEELFFGENLSQYTLDFKNYIANLIDLIPYIKLSGEEVTLLYKAFAVIKKVIISLEEESDEDGISENLFYLNVGKMMDSLLH
jgi:hypothetical protein